MTVQERYQQWLDCAVDDPELQEELAKIGEDQGELEDRFARELEFGTAGLRGVIGAGSFRMNIYTVRRATQGLADYIKSQKENASVAIAYDSRIKSDLFAKEAAAVMAANGITAYLFPELAPTPLLSFAVRELHAQAGINVTASHNPSKYNGYKVYGADGCQMTDEAAGAVLKNIEKWDFFQIPVMPFEEGLRTGKIVLIDDEVGERFLDCVQQQCINPELAASSGLKVIYTPLNGAGNKYVRRILGRIGITDVTVVPEQELPDGNFPTCPYPNPEIKQVFECGLKLAEKIEPDLLLATDPDSDRVGIAVKEGDDYRLFTGNEVGAMLLRYILSQRTEKGTMPQNPLAIKTIVSTPMIYPIAKQYHCEVKDVLTGFKYIGEQIGLLEKENCSDRYVFGFEESYGYLAGTYVRDKDAVVASMLICEMAAYYKTKGMSLVDALDGMYQEYGYYLNTTDNFQCEGLAGMEKMQSIMEGLRANRPEELGGIPVIHYADYLKSTSYDCKTGSVTPITLPKSNVLSYTLEDGANVIVRPSGTEPKIKVYVAAKGKSKEDSESLSDALRKAVTAMLGF